MARPKTWSSSSDDRFDGASEEDVEMICKPGGIQRKGDSFDEELEQIDTLEGVVGYFLEHGFSC